MFSRYAIYYTPAPGTPLATFGATWLGWDSAAGSAVAQPETDLDIEAATRTPRRYGFHGTLKPPFRLAEGCTAKGLAEAVEAVAAQVRPIRIDALRLTRIGRFLALVPTGDTSALAALAARLVTELDPFRAPLTDSELARRQTARLTSEQQAHLQNWGYPYVLDAFRFHLTLTGRLDHDMVAAAEAALSPLLDAIPLDNYDLTGVTLLGEDENGLFHQIRRFPLMG